MFQIKKYLQFRNTLDGKPRVLVEGVDYKMKTATQLLDGNVGIMPYQEWIANLSDCRPLLSVEIDGKVWEDGDVGTYFGENPTFILSIRELLKEVYYCPNIEIDGSGFSPRNQNLGSFFDNPAKYSKLLWGCTEEEGWRKVFEIIVD